MADILPIRPWRYNDKLSASMETLGSPTADRWSEPPPIGLYKQPFSSIHLTAPRDGEESPGRLLQKWKRDEILIQDDLPAIYVYYQYFTLSGSSKQYCRKGFTCHIRIYDSSDKIILRYEDPVVGVVKEGVKLLEETEMHVSPTRALYTDADLQLEAHMDEAITDPIYDVVDNDGVRNVFAVIHDARIIQKFINVLSDKSVVLADGGHHYESALAYRKRHELSNTADTSKAGYNFHLVHLTNTEGSDIPIFPTYPLIKKLPSFNSAEILERLKSDFTLTSVDDHASLADIIAGEQWAFGIAFKDTAWKLQLKAESLSRSSLPFPDDIKNLDVTVMYEFIIRKIPGLETNQETSEHLDFTHSFSDCITKVKQTEAQLAIITNSISVATLKKISQSGFTIPQNSTYFYPQMINGFVFTSVSEAEFVQPSYAPF